jgi:hypothetical protein
MAGSKLSPELVRDWVAIEGRLEIEGVPVRSATEPIHPHKVNSRWSLGVRYDTPALRAVVTTGADPDALDAASLGGEQGAVQPRRRTSVNGS